MAHACQAAATREALDVGATVAELGRLASAAFLSIGILALAVKVSPLKGYETTCAAALDAAAFAPALCGASSSSPLLPSGCGGAFDACMHVSSTLRSNNSHVFCWGFFCISESEVSLRISQLHLESSSATRACLSWLRF